MPGWLRLSYGDVPWWDCKPYPFRIESRLDLLAKLAAHGPVVVGCHGWKHPKPDTDLGQFFGDDLERWRPDDARVARDDLGHHLAYTVEVFVIGDGEGEVDAAYHEPDRKAPLDALQGSRSTSLAHPVHVPSGTGRLSQRPSLGYRSLSYWVATP
jgi:hypothetical protein